MYENTTERDGALLQRNAPDSFSLTGVLLRKKRKL